METHMADKKQASKKKPAPSKAKPAPKSAPKGKSAPKKPVKAKPAPAKKPTAAPRKPVAKKPAPKAPAPKVAAANKSAPAKSTPAKTALRKPIPPPPTPKPVAKTLQVGALTGRAALKALTTRSSSEPVLNTKHFTPKEIEFFRQLLLNSRDRMVDDISFLVGDNLNRSARDAAGDLSHYSIHMADQGTDNFDREFALNLASGDQDLLYEIDEALVRIENQTYGMCEMTGQPIEKERLKVIPQTRYCVAAQSEMERGKTKYRPFGPSMSLGG